MAQFQEATAKQLDFTYEGERRPAAEPLTAPRRGPARLCALCGRVPAHLTLERQHGRRPARLCLRCHHAVMRQRRMVRATLDTSARPPVNDVDVRLIVPRDNGLSGDRKYRQLAQSRHRAQKAARRALELTD